MDERDLNKQETKEHECTSSEAKKKCSHNDSCGNQKWECIDLTEFWREYQCINCKGTKTIFRNLYPGYQDGN